MRPLRLQPGVPPRMLLDNRSALQAHGLELGLGLLQHARFEVRVLLCGAVGRAGGEGFKTRWPVCELSMFGNVSRRWVRTQFVDELLPSPRLRVPFHATHELARRRHPVGLRFVHLAFEGEREKENHHPAVEKRTTLKVRDIVGFVPPPLPPPPPPRQERGLVKLTTN